MKKDKKKIVERQILFIPPEGLELNLTLSENRRGLLVNLGIGPFVDEGGCMVSFDGFMMKPKCVRGLDHFQALCLAVNFMHSILNDLQKNGWKFDLCDDGSVPRDGQNADEEPSSEYIMPIDTLFGSLKGM